jgi:hypothetical protein
MMVAPWSRKRSGARRKMEQPRAVPVPVPELDPGNVLSDDSLDCCIPRRLPPGISSIDESIDLEYLKGLRRTRFRRCTDTFHYSGDLRKAIQHDEPLDVKTWRSLPEHEFERRWLAEFRMKELVFREQLAHVQPHVGTSQPKNSNIRTYTAEDKLLVTLNFLAHCSSLRQMATKWGIPHCSISTLCLHPVVRALQDIFVLNANTKNILWPKEDDEQVCVMDRFKKRCQLPGCIGAVDGSLIPQRKSTKEQANQDSDSYYGYKGGIASLLLAVCVADMKFTYVNAGASACVKDASLFSRSQVKASIDQGMLKQVSVPLHFEDGTWQDIFPYLVGDAAFPLGQHFLKVYEPPPEGNSAQAKCNRRLLDARWLIEQAFGRLKGKFVFCSKNSFWNDVCFTREAIEACCGVHNFLEVRKTDMPDDAM